MEKILSFIVNENKELLLLKGSPNDPQFKKSLWYVVTGGFETIDKTKEDTVKREIKEETNVEAQKVIYLNWILKYKSLGIECIEYVYITFFCFKDDKNKNLLWFVPMSKHYEKYFKVYNAKKQKINKEPNNFVFFNNIAGIKGVFLIQNIFPTCKIYVQQEYLRRGQKIKVSKVIQREILDKAKDVIALANKGIVATYTNLPEFIKEIEQEIFIIGNN